MSFAGGVGKTKYAGSNRPERWKYGKSGVNVQSICSKINSEGVMEKIGVG
jgi:hypothetical protein